MKFLKIAILLTFYGFVQCDEQAQCPEKGEFFVHFGSKLPLSLHLLQEQYVATSVQILLVFVNVVITHLKILKDIFVASLQIRLVRK